MAAPHPDLVAFLTPGLVHQFGNLLFTIQGHALTLDPDTLNRAKAATLTACERGAMTLRIVRHLLGDGALAHCDAGDAAQALAELLRTPVREEGHAFVLHPPMAGLGPVELGSFVGLVTAAVRELLRILPTGVPGSVELSLVHRPGAVVVMVAFRGPAGRLPFPLASGEAAAKVAAMATSHGHRGEVRARGSNLELVLPAHSAGVLEA